MHIKYRPSSLDDFIGNEPVKKVIANIIAESGYRPILLEGGTGLGKTTLAYILANSFGASKENIDEVDCVDLVGINEMREIVKELFRTSLFGKKKVLILDELHELRTSKSSQRELLKPLEKLPKHIFVVACTTDTSKLDPALLGRFKRLRVYPLSDTDSRILIEKISSLENINLPKPIRSLLINSCSGVPRRLLVGLSTIKNVSDVEEANYLLELSILEENKEVLELFKVFLSKPSWFTFKSALNTTLKSVSVSGIRIGMMNLIGGRLMSSYIRTEDEGRKLYLAFKILSDADSYPEKACLIVALYKCIDILEGKI